jgi:hypothetical protein
LNIVSFKKDEDQTEVVRAERENQDEIIIGRDKDKQGGALEEDPLL